MALPLVNRKRTLTTVAAVGLTVLMSACDGVGRSPVSPTSAIAASTPTPPPAPAVGGTLSGVVFELNAGLRVPVDGVQVYCDACGPDGHTLTLTDANGAYSLEGAPAGVTQLLLSRAGYKLPHPGSVAPFSGWMGSIDAIVNGDTRFDIEIVRQ